MSGSTMRGKRIAVICVTAAFVVGGGGAAFAYWTASGSGAGSATTGTSTAFTVTTEAPTGGSLVPGGSAQTVAFTVTNASSGPLVLSSIVVSVADADGTLWDSTPGCAAADYEVGTPDIVYGSIAGGADVDGTVTVTMVNTAVNQDACQGVDVPLYFLAT